MNLFSFKKKSYLSFVFDIRDTSISVAATKFENNKKPEIIYCQNFKIDYQEDVESKKYTTSMIRTLDKAILTVRKNIIKIGFKGDIKKYSFFIGSPWSVSQSKTIKFIKDKVFNVDNNFLRRIILNEEDKIEKEIENNSKGIDWKIIEDKIIQSKLNGYKTNKIYERKTKDIELDIFVSFVPQEILNKISSVVDNKTVKQQTNSCVLSSFSFLRDLYTDKNDFLYIDIGEIITDIYVVKDDVVFGIISFPFGEKNIIQSISKASKISEDIVLSSINIKCHGKCDPKEQNRLEHLISIGMSKWFDKFNNTILKICSENNIPQNIFILPNTSLIKTFAERIKTVGDLELFKKFGLDVKVTIIEESIFDDLITNSKFFKKEPYIKMDLIFLNKDFNK